MPWHPFFVHFPLALVTFGVLVDLAAWGGRRPAWHRVAYVLLMAGTIGAAAALVTGNASAARWRDSVYAGAIQDHEDFATLAFLVLLATSLGRLPRFLRRADAGGNPWMWVGAGVVGLGLLYVAAVHGGRLVYELGVGVSAPPRPP